MDQEIVGKVLDAGNKLEDESYILYAVLMALVGLVFYIIKTTNKGINENVNENAKTLAAMSEQMRTMASSQQCLRDDFLRLYSGRKKDE